MTTNDLIEQIRDHVSIGRKATAAFLGYTAPDDQIVLAYLAEHLGLQWRTDLPFGRQLVFNMMYESICKATGADRYIWTETAPANFYTEVVIGMIEPDDYQWQFLEEAVGNLSEVDDGDDLDDVEPNEEIYFSEGVKWLASSTNRSSYVDEYRDEVGDSGATSNILQDLLAGMYTEKREVYVAARQAVETFVEDFEHPQCGWCEAYTPDLNEDEICHVCVADNEDEDEVEYEVEDEHGDDLVFTQ